MAAPDSNRTVHEQAFEAFASRATDRFGDTVREIVCFGSVARGEAHGIDSDVDVLVVVEDAALESDLRALAYDVQLEYGVVLSLHVLSTDRFDARRDHPFLQTVLDEGVTYE